MSTIEFSGHGTIGVRSGNASWPLPPTRAAVWPSSPSSGSTRPNGSAVTMMVADPVSARLTLTARRG